MKDPEHAEFISSFPFIDSLQGACYNCQSLFAHGRGDTQRFVLHLLHQLDFIGLTETRSTPERLTTLDPRFHTDCLYLESSIDQFKGGIGLLLKRSFLEQFEEVVVNRDWVVLVEGRIGRLSLCGPRGCLELFIVYLDPSSAANQISSIKLLGTYIKSCVHTLILGDFNFVHCKTDRLLKATNTWSLGDDKAVDRAWVEHISSRGIKEWAQESHTCETGIAFSRIDRVYSSLHPAHGVHGRISCQVQQRLPDLSTHWPLFFSLRTVSSDSSFQKIPSWIYNH